MMSNYSTGRLLATVLAGLSLLAESGYGQTPPPTAAGRTATSPNGKYVITLKPLPAEGLFAAEETDIEFFLGDATRVDPVLGPAPVIRAQIRGRVTMPAMPGMPEALSEAHVEGQPGYYGVITDFPHGGDYLLTLQVRPPNDAPFTVQFPLRVKDAPPGSARRPRPYTVRLETSPRTVKAGEPVELRLRVFSRQKPKEAIREFDIVHEQLQHLIIVSRDLAYFDHVHPALDPKSGTFTLRHTFPSGGDYRLFSDLTPKGAGMQVLISPLKVQGAAASRPAALTPTAPLRTSAGGVTIALQPRKGPLTARTDEMLTAAFTAGGAPVTNLEPWLGALGHMVLIHEDAATFVHSHPQEEIPASGTPKPSVLNFYARFPKPGLYKGWVQFQRNGSVRTAPFVVRVGES